MVGKIMLQYQNGMTLPKAKSMDDIGPGEAPF